MPSRLFKVSVLARYEHEELFVGDRGARPKFGIAPHASYERCRPKPPTPCSLANVYLSHSAYSVCEVIFGSGLSHRGLFLNQPCHHHHTPRQLRVRAHLKKTGTAHVPSLNSARQAISRVDSILATIANINTWFPGRDICYEIFSLKKSNEKS